MAAESKSPKPAKLRPDLAPIFNRIDHSSARLGISRSLLYRWIAAKRISVIKIGTRTLISEAELQRVGAELVRNASKVV